MAREARPQNRYSMLCGGRLDGEVRLSNRHKVINPNISVKYSSEKQVIRYESDQYISQNISQNKQGQNTHEINLR